MKLQTSSPHSKLLIPSFLLEESFCKEVQMLSRLLCMFQKCWLLTAISFIVVQLTHIIYTIIIMQSQSQNVCKCFQTQKNLIRNSHSLEKLLGRLPCSPTMNTLGKEDIWDVGNQQPSITPKSPPSPYSHLCSSF